LRRPGAAAQLPLVVANLTFDLASREVNIEGRPVEMHRRELLLLEALMRRARRVATREALL
jgi:two-component system, OmpR family, response regulator